MAHIIVGEACGGVQQGAPHFVTHLEFVLHPMLIMSFLVLSIGFVQFVMNLLENVLNALNEAVFLGNFRLDMS